MADGYRFVVDGSVAAPQDARMADTGRGERDHARTLAIGSRVRELRLERGLTQEALAQRATVHRAVVGFIERGEREPGVSLVWRLADGLGVSMATLMSGIEETVPDLSDASSTL